MDFTEAADHCGTSSSGHDAFNITVKLLTVVKIATRKPTE